VTRSHHPIAGNKTEGEKDRQPNADDRDAIMLCHLTNQRFSELRISFQSLAVARRTAQQRLQSVSCDPAILLLFQAVISLL
jgi:hypothetical protein